MNSLLLMCLSDDDENEINANDELRIRRKFIRSGSSPLDLSCKRFIKLFRLSKETFKYVLDEIEPHFKARSASGIPPILKLAATIRFLAEGSYQQSVGQDFLVGMAQSTVSVVMSEVLEILEKELCTRFIQFDRTENELRECKQHFFSKFGFPGIIGCIDGTHISIVRPTENEDHFYNRKGFHSINAMITCDHKMQIRSVDPCYGGASHDSFVWSLSDERQYLSNLRENGDRNSWLLGDSAYPLEPWMMTPFRVFTDNSDESYFNYMHSKIRCLIERCFGMLKGRFRCLLKARQLHYTPEKAAQIINVCCLLHNLCMTYNTTFDESLFINEEQEFDLTELEIEIDAELDEIANLRSTNLAKDIRNRIKTHLR